MESGKVVAIILAGGLSSRMKAFKPLLPIGGEPALLVAVKGFRAAGIKTIYVVTGHQRELLAPLIAQEGLIEVYNQDYEKGMFSSIGAGIAAAKNAEGGILLLPVDCPLVFPEVIKRVLAAATEKNMVVPCYLGKKGHPLYLPQRYVERILAHDGKHGLKGVLEPLEQELIRVDGGREGVLLDMDDQAGYEEILRYVQRGEEELDLQALAAGKRIFLLRHGEIQQHAGKIFLGQTDVPLSSQGKEDSRLLAEELKQEGLCTKQIYTGDLKRTVQTAEIVASLLDIGQIIQRPALREMALGAWDGKPIEEIKALYPEEYKKRGENLFTYKPDHHWESFFDLQYRVVKALKGILEEVTLQGETDIVIVAHKGVLRVIENNLDGKSVEFPWETIQPAKYRCKSY